MSIAQGLIAIGVALAIGLSTIGVGIGQGLAAVVNELYECPSGILHRQGNGTRAGIHGILHQFLDYGSGTLDHLAGGYHIGKVAW